MTAQSLKPQTKPAAKPKLSPALFGLKVENHDLVRTAYEAYLANGRANLASTLSRGLVRGGGRKPWRQKGTGRARFGSSRNPIWRGGGIAFGPTGNENYSKSINLKARRLALKQALSLSAGKVQVIEDIKLKTHKTKDLLKELNKHKLTRNTLLVVDKPVKELVLASNNLPNLLISTTSALNVYDVMNADHILITKPAITVIETRLGDKK